MGQNAKPTRQNRTITVDFQAPSTYVQRMHEGKAFVACVFAFLLSLGFQLAHKAPCTGGGCLTRHAHSARMRLGGLTIWRLQCPSCQAVLPVLPHCVLRYRRRSPAVARQALLAPHGGLSLAWCAPILHLSTMSLSRLLCALGHHRVVTGLPRCGLPLPPSILADDKHSHGLTARVSWPTIVRGRGSWPLGDSASNSAAACPESSGVFQRAALQHEPSSQVRGALPDGFDSPVSSRRARLPGARLGFCRRPALNHFPDQLSGVSASVRQGLRSACHALRHRCRQRQSLRGVAWGQRLRHWADRIATPVGEAHGARVRPWFQSKQAGWYTVRAAPPLPAMSPGLEQAHHALDRHLFAMQGFPHPGGSQAASLTGLAQLYHLIPDQRRAKNAGLCGGQVEGGRVPRSDWMLNLPILTSGGYRYAPDPPNH